MKRVLLAGCAFTVLAAAAACAPKTPTYSFKYAEKRAELDNGLKLVVIPDENTPMVHVAVRYLVGSNEDPEGKAGLAHLVEHMMFQHRLLGENKPPTFQLLPQIATFYNAFTNFETTHYFLEARLEDLEGLLKLEAARMAMGCDTIPEAEFEREREVVRNEIRQRGGEPEGLIDDVLLQAVYPEGHAYRQTVGGTDEQLTNIEFDDVCQFMKDYYVPQRATLVVVGNVDVEEVGKKVNQYFGAIQAGEPAPRKEIEPLEDFDREEIVKEIDTERSHVMVLWRLPSYFNEDAGPKARAMTASLCGQVRFFNRDWDFAASVSCAPFPTKLAPFLLLDVELYDAKDKDEALDYVWKAIDDVHRGFEEGIFERETKAVAKGNFVLGLESLSARAIQVAEMVQFRDDFDFESDREYLLEELQRIDQLDGGEFRNFMKGRLKKKNAKIIFIKSSKKGLKGDKRAGLEYKAHTEHKRDTDPIIDPAEALQPLPAPETDSILKEAERYSLDNGLDVILLPFEGLPIVTSMLVFNAGAAHEPPNKAGLAQVAANYLFPPRGSEVSRTGVRVGSQGVGADTTIFYARGIEIYLDVALRGLERLIKVGTHNQKAIERWQKVTKTRFESERYRRRRAFQQEFAAAVYGPDHPYTVTGSATQDTLGRIGYDAAMDFKRKHYSAANGTLIVVGSFDALEAKDVIEQHFGAWGSGHSDEPVPPAPRKRSGPEYFGVIAPDSTPQVQVQLAYPSPAGIDGQHAARRVLAQMLNLRMAKLRSELGSTYGTYAGRQTQLGPSAYVIGGNLDEERAGESLKYMREQIEELRQGEDFELYFARARRIILKQLLAESTDTMSLARRLGQIATYDLGLDYFDQQIRFVAAVSPAQVKALMQAELQPDFEVIGAVGDREHLEKAFEEAGIESVRYVEPK